MMTSEGDSTMARTHIVSTCIRARQAMAGGALVVIFVLAMPRSGAAYPNMIRLGYVQCSACHVSPQGGGVLNLYGQGIDSAQTLRADDARGAEDSGGLRARFLYDVRAQLGIDRAPGAAAVYGLNTSFRTAVGLSAEQQVVYAFSVRSPSLSTTRQMGATSLAMSRLYW